MTTGRRAVHVSLAACALCTGLVLMVSPAHASPTSALTVSERIAQPFAASLPVSRVPSSPSSWSASSLAAGGFLSIPSPESCNSADSAVSECTPLLLLQVRDELRAFHSMAAIGAALIVALLATAAMLLIGRR